MNNTLTWSTNIGRFPQMVVDSKDYRYSRFNPSYPYYDGGRSGTYGYPTSSGPKYLLCTYCDRIQCGNCRNCGSNLFTNQLHCMPCYDAKVLGPSRGELSMYIRQPVITHSGNVVETISASASSLLNSQDRQARLERNQRTLYHQTTAPVANYIVHTQRMLPGNDGLAGAGIYFAVTPADTDRKARETGTILSATILLGNVKTVNKNGSSESLSSLIAEGYDSVCIPRERGTEYVVYHSDQIQNIRIYRK